MSVLTKTDIEKFMQMPKIEERLIVTPLLNPDESIDVSSVDVRLGNKFILMNKQFFPCLDISGENMGLAETGRYQQSIPINYHRPFYLHPQQLVIGCTFEYVQIPPGLMCYVVGKSTWGRMGLIIATATKVDPGFKGCITLEIINEGVVPLKLYPGLPIAQLVIEQATDKSDVYSGKYACRVGPKFPKFNTDSRDWQFWVREERQGN